MRYRQDEHCRSSSKIGHHPSIAGVSIRISEWMQRDDGRWALRRPESLGAGRIDRETLFPW
jgi:hypothetical protein